MDAIRISEIFYSLQGEGRETGYPTLFIRLAGCNLRCNYCDTEYSFEKGRFYSWPELEKFLNQYQFCSRILITGGEPLLQKKALKRLIEILLTQKRLVSIETNGSQDLSWVDPAVHKVVDVKLSGSGQGNSFLLDNLKFLTALDELKFVISHRVDFQEALDFINLHLDKKFVPCIFSPVLGKLEASLLADWILQERRSDIKLGLQIHKFIGVK